MPPRAGVLALAAVLAVALGVSACTGVVSGDFARTDVPPRSPSAGESAAPDTAGGCPAQPVAPHPDRPRIALEFVLGVDAGSVTGTEQVEFTPDLATDELVFRLTANQPFSASDGARVVVGEVAGADVDSVGFQAAGAAPDTQGGLLVVGLDRELAAGETTRVSVDFELFLGSGGFDRFGSEGTLAWWGSGHPLLAWVPGQGWSRSGLLDNPGETAVSMVADTSVSVLAPAGRTVSMTGGAERVGAEGDLVRWRASDPTARDVAVTVGELVEAAGPVGTSQIRVVAPAAAEAGQLLARAQQAVVDLSELFGPFPYETMTLARLPDAGGGVEYPGMIFLADGSDLVLVHELAHMWFYGMVGNDQGQHPWLDEAFAAYAEAVLDGPTDDLDGRLALPLPVGTAVADFASTDDYFATVYDKGSAALLAARAAVGAKAFDAAVRCYVNSLAWQIATPEDVERALSQVPAAVQILRAAGALP